MGLKIKEDVLIKYAEQWTGVKSFPREPLSEYVDRVYNVMEGARFPFGSFYAVTERCSFLEAVMLSRKRSLLLSLLDQMEDTVLIGVEQSTAFVGKYSLFCAFRCEDPIHFSDKMKTLTVSDSSKGHVVCANVQSNNEVLVAASFAAFIHSPF